MTLLDTDHVSVLLFPGSDRAKRLETRLSALPPAEVGVAIPTVEESLRGWLTTIAKEREVARHVNAYRALAKLVEFFPRFAIAPFDDAAAAVFASLGPVRIGTMDRKIASIALAQKALLLTANRRDFGRVPGLAFADWLG